MRELYYSYRYRYSFFKRKTLRCQFINLFNRLYCLFGDVDAVLKFDRFSKKLCQKHHTRRFCSFESANY